MKVFSLKVSGIESNVQELVDDSDSDGCQEVLQGLENRVRNVVVMALHFYEPDEVGELEEHSDACPAAEEGVAHSFEEGRELLNSLVFAVVLQLVRTGWVSVRVRKDKCPEAHNLEHCESRHVNWVLAFVGQHCVDVIVQNHAHEERDHKPLALLSRQDHHGDVGDCRDQENVNDLVAVEVRLEEQTPEDAEQMAPCSSPHKRPEEPAENKLERHRHHNSDLFVLHSRRSVDALDEHLNRAS